jgi:hypothetical protein
MFPPEMSPRSVLPRVLAVALLLSVPAAARAQDADALIKQGVELRRAGKDQAALEQFRRAYDLAPTPRALAQLGLAEQALGRWIDGEAHIIKALEAEQDPWISKYRETLEGSRAEIAKHLGSLSVTGGPAGAELRIDGQPVGALPLRRTLRLPLGTFALEASEGGHVVVARAVSIVAGMTTREDLSGPAAATGPVALAARPSTNAGPREGDDSGASAGVGRRTLAWAAAGGALVLAGAGGALLAFGDRNADEHNNGPCRDMPSDSCASLQRRGEREQVAGVAGLVVGGALGATAVLLFLTMPPSRDGGRTVACAPAFEGLGASCAMRF